MRCAFVLPSSLLSRGGISVFDFPCAIREFEHPALGVVPFQGINRAHGAHLSLEPSTS